MKRQSLFFSKPFQVDLVEEPVPDFDEDTLLIRSRYSAISAGTEMLVYSGRMPAGMPTDASIASLAGNFTYPLKYGYSVVGTVEAVGSRIDPGWAGKTVFAFHPHETLFAAHPSELLPVPEDLTLENAVFLPNMETAVGLVMDARPMIGEQVVVYGQGLVGLLTTALLNRFPVKQILTLDRHEIRRQQSLLAGARQSLDPGDADCSKRMTTLLSDPSTDGLADLILELSGNPAALDDALALAGYHTRIVIGSWYGTQMVSLNLGGTFHRNRIKLISSQVSTVGPELTGRWSKTRRFDTVWEMIRRIEPSRWITHRFDFADAARAYALLDQHPQDVLQVILEYG